jgi:drug/metabolite transporter (DMT)-like permease
MLYGLRWTTAAASGIVTSATPALIVLFSYLFLGERLDARRIAAMVFTMLGIVALSLASGPAGTSSDGPALDGASLAGMALVFCAAIGEALYTVLGKGLTRKLSPLAIATGVSLIGFALFLPLGLLEAVQFSFAEVSARAWLLIVYYAVFVTVTAFMLWYYGVSRVAANSAAVFTGMIPVAAVLLSYAVLGESFRWGHALGIFGVLAGIACIAWPRR